MAATVRFGSFEVIALLAALIAFLAVQGFAIWQTNGIFEYPIDDVYIHLATAENLARGGYGVNVGEYSAPSSSPFYSFLVMPFGLGDGQRFLPLFWNTVGLCLSAFIWARVLTEAGFGTPRLRKAGLVAAVLGPSALLMVSSSVLGMEHSLHAAASLAIVLGLFLFLRDDRPGWLLFAGILFAPILRYEGLALALLAVAVLFVRGARRQAALGLVLALAPLLVFSGFLLSLGLDPLPGSVLAKMAATSKTDLGTVERLLFSLGVNLSLRGGVYLAVVIIGLLLIVRMGSGLKDAKWQLFAAVAVAAGAAHLTFGQVGFKVHRYEHYALVALSAFAVVLLGQSRLPAKVVSWATIGLVVAPLGLFTVNNVRYLSMAPRSIYLQQRQMAVFAQDHLKTNVAVNDLGWVSWQNPDYVLDLWGLASAESRRIRLSDPGPHWADPLVAKYQVAVAMIYDTWLGDAVGPDWIAVGQLRMEKFGSFLGEGADLVTFYATGPEYEALLRDAIDDWAPSLPQGASFDFVEKTP